VVAAKVVNETVTYAKVALGRRHELKLNRIDPSTIAQAVLQPVKSPLSPPSTSQTSKTAAAKILQDAPAHKTPLYNTLFFS
jgi:hypothetical protein